MTGVLAISECAVIAQSKHSKNLDMHDRPCYRSEEQNALHHDKRVGIIEIRSHIKLGVYYDLASQANPPPCIATMKVKPLE